MKEMFTYMFKDKDFNKKALILFIFSFLSFIFICLSQLFIEYFAPLSAICFLLLMFPFGYFLLCTKHLIEKKEDSIIPEFDYFRCFSLCFKLCINVILSLTLFLNILLLSGVIAILIALFISSKAIIPVIMNITSLIMICLFFFYNMAFNYILAKNEWFTSFTRYILVTKLIKQNLKIYLKYFGLNAILNIVTQIIPQKLGYSFLTTKNVYIMILASLILGILHTYFAFVSAYLVSKSIDDNAFTNID